MYYYNIISHFLGLLLLKRKPQELQYSKKTFFLFIILIILVSYINILVLGIKIPNIKVFMFLSILINNFSFFLILYLFLLKNGFKNRFIQTSSNFLGIEIINCIFFLLFILINNNIYNEYMPFFLSLVIALWFLLVRINIIRHSFNYGILTSLIVLLSFFFISLIMSMTLTFMISVIYNTI